MKLSQKELVNLVSLLKQVQLPFKDSKDINQIIDKLESYIIKSKPEDVTLVQAEGVK